MVNTREDLHQRIVRLRKAANLTQESLAALAGISSQTIKDIESGRTGGGLKSLTRIAKALDITVDELKGDKEPTVERVIRFKVSKMAKFISSIPDDVYDLAAELDDTDDEIWRSVREALLVAIADKKLKQRG